MSSAASKSKLPPSLMRQSLRGISILAAQTWRQLQMTETPEAETQVLEELWRLQEDQEAAIDAHAELADQLDAEIAAVQARMQYLIQLHMKELDRLTHWRAKLDDTILRLNESGLMGLEAPGHTRRIKIKFNPPSCEIEDETKIPEKFIVTRTIPEAVECKPDKKAIKAAWNQGIPIPGTRIDRKRKVIYEIAPSSLEAMRAI